MATGRSVVVLGAGVTGLTVAWELSKLFKDRVVLLEKEPAVGGLAATTTKDNLSFDVGSHRLHEGYDPDVDALIKDLCGSELLRRERRGLIYVKDRALSYPPSPFEVLFAFGIVDFLRFVSGFLLAGLCRLLDPREPDDFEGFTVRRVGKSLYERFYKPYATKLYGTSPRRISKEPAMSRVRKFALSSFYGDLKKRIRRKQPHYLYPSRGIGQLSAALKQRFLENGGDLVFISRIERFAIEKSRTIRAIDFVRSEGKAGTLPTDLVVSTIPLDALYHLIGLGAETNGHPPFNLRWRGLRLLYLITADKIPSEHETYYFPEPHIVFGRVSELNKYSPLLNPDPHRTVLTVEIPCSCNDEVWNMAEDRLADRCVQELQRQGILRKPLAGEMQFCGRKVNNVYPMYELGWRKSFDRILQQVNSFDNLYSIGRSALFLHCNIDHCMAMALTLAKYLAAGHTSKNGWEAIQRSFFDYRVRE